MTFFSIHIIYKFSMEKLSPKIFLVNASNVK